MLQKWHLVTNYVVGLSLSLPDQAPPLTLLTSSQATLLLLPLF